MEKASAETSPTVLLPVFFEASGTLLMPTSMTTAPGLIQEAFEQEKSVTILRSKLTSALS
jgi:hypothetical protein